MLANMLAFQFSKPCVRYWLLKAIDPQLSNKSWGGARNQKFSTLERLTMALVIWNRCKRYPLSSLNQFRKALVDANSRWQVSKNWLSKLFTTGNWSFKKPSRTQYLKYSVENVRHYISFINWVDTVSWARLKFLDESHFVSRSK
jgi:hypothetical protein